jgi:PAS domain-containing protein
MRTVCSKCRRIVRDDGIGGSSPTKVELCTECVAYERTLRASVPGRDRLEASPQPLLVITPDAKVVAANAAFAALAGRAPSELEGWLIGEATGCARAKLPGGCGRTLHCHACTVRRMVAEVGRTRLARWRVPAYVVTATGRREICVTIRPEGEDLVVVAIEDAPEDREQPDRESRAADPLVATRTCLPEK